MHVCLDGLARAVEALSTIITDEANHSGLFTAIWHAGTPGLAPEDRQLARLVEKEYAGTPDPDDLLLTTKTGHSPDMMDQRAGLLFFLPVIPLSGRAVEHSQFLLRQAADETGARCGATYFTLDSDLTLAVVAIKFNREQAEATRAHQALDRLYQLFTASGFTPCRLDIDHTGTHHPLGEYPSVINVWEIFKAIKSLQPTRCWRRDRAGVPLPR